MPRAPTTTLCPRQPRVLHAHQLPLGSSRTTSYWERSTLIQFVTPQTAFRMTDRPHKPTRVFFSELCPHLHAFWETSPKVTHPKTTPSQARLTVEFFWNDLPKRRCILLV
ncbi:hypothetical protein QL285_035067 [Trifolium repens]|nr:hypothetical protein QL285_035067 [Trifolium repens]